MIFWRKKKRTKVSEWVAAEKRRPGITIAETTFYVSNRGKIVMNYKDFTVPEAIKLARWILEVCE
jgi:hypothetical protein